MGSKPQETGLSCAPRPALALDQDIKAAGTVRASDNCLLDVCRARRPADQIDRPRQGALAVNRAQAVEGLLVAADDIAGAHQNEMGLRQEGERRRIVGP